MNFAMFHFGQSLLNTAEYLRKERERTEALAAEYERLRRESMYDGSLGVYQCTRCKVFSAPPADDKVQRRAGYLCEDCEEAER